MGAWKLILDRYQGRRVTLIKLNNWTCWNLSSEGILGRELDVGDRRAPTSVVAFLLEDQETELIFIDQTGFEDEGNY